MTVIANGIARVLKNSGSAQTVALDKGFLHCLTYWYSLEIKVIWCYEKVFYLIELFRSCKRLWIVLKHKSSSKRAVNAWIGQNVLSNIFKWTKGSEMRLYEKLKTFSRVWKVLKQLFNVSSFWVCASFPYTENLNSYGSYNDCNE